LPSVYKQITTDALFKIRDSVTSANNLPSVVSSSAVLGVLGLLYSGRNTTLGNACRQPSGADARDVNSGLAFCEGFAAWLFLNVEVGLKTLLFQMLQEARGRCGAGFSAEVFL